MKSRLESCMERSLMNIPLLYRSSGLSILEGEGERGQEREREREREGGGGGRGGGEMD